MHRLILVLYLGSRQPLEIPAGRITHIRRDPNYHTHLIQSHDASYMKIKLIYTSGASVQPAHLYILVSLRSSHTQSIKVIERHNCTLLGHFWRFHLIANISLKCAPWLDF